MPAAASSRVISASSRRRSRLSKLILVSSAAFSASDASRSMVTAANARLRPSMAFMVGLGAGWWTLGAGREYRCGGRVGIVVVDGCRGGKGGGERALCEGATGSTGQCWSRQLYPEERFFTSADRFSVHLRLSVPFGSTPAHGGQGIWAIQNHACQVPYHGPCQAPRTQGPDRRNESGRKAIFFISRDCPSKRP